MTKRDLLGLCGNRLRHIQDQAGEGGRDLVRGKGHQMFHVVLVNFLERVGFSPLGSPFNACFCDYPQTRKVLSDVFEAAFQKGSDRCLKVQIRGRRNNRGARWCIYSQKRSKRGPKPVVRVEGRHQTHCRTTAIQTFSSEESDLLRFEGRLNSHRSRHRFETR